MKEIRMMLHIPDYEEVCTLTMLQQIKHLVEVISSSQTVINEWWQIDLDDEGASAAVYSNDVQMGEYWSDGWKAISENRIAQISSVIQYKNRYARGKLSVDISAVLVSSAKYHKLPRSNGERWISLRMTQPLWSELDQKSFIQCIKDMYCALKSTYVCIDEMAPIGGIYEGNFRLLNDTNSVADLENILPGIYWFQIVSSRFLRRTGNLSEIMNNVPCEHVELLDVGQQKGLLLQISSRIKDGNRKKRLMLREFFKNSLYNISLDIHHLDRLSNIRHYKNMCGTHQKELMRMLRMVPLTDDEIHRFLEIIDSVE